MIKRETITISVIRARKIYLLASFDKHKTYNYHCKTHLDDVFQVGCIYIYIYEYHIPGRDLRSRKFNSAFEAQYNSRTFRSLYYGVNLKILRVGHPQNQAVLFET